MFDIEYSNACTEVLEVLKYIPKEDYNKIPKKKLEVLEMDKNINHIFNYDLNKTLEEQNISEKAETIIAIFFRDYWATEKQREIILANERQYNKRKEEIRKEYNTDDLFKNRKSNKDEYNKNDVQNKVSSNNNIQMIEYKKEKWHQRLFNKILNIFRKK